MQNTHEEQDNIVSLARAADLMLILDTPKGRGVFAKSDIKSGQVIDVSPVLVLSNEDNREHIEKTELYHYTYNWPVITKDSTIDTRQAVVFGLGSMFNHSRDQNVGWTRDAAKLTITYYALRDIPAGDELCISYGARLTFKDADADKNADSGTQDEECDEALRLTQIAID